MEDSFSSDSDAWLFTVIRSQGLGPLRPEKAWRPIVTATFDGQHHEIVLGSDGQNPNLKRPFYLRHANPKAVMDIDVWHKSQSKKKARKRNQVASVRLSLGEILKRQGAESKAEIRLKCTSSAKPVQNARSKQQIRAFLYVKLYPPASYSSPSESLTLQDMEEDSLPSDSSSTLTSPSTPTSVDFGQSLTSEPAEHQKTRRRRVRGYSVDPDNEDMEDEYSIDGDFDTFSYVEDDSLLYNTGLDCEDSISNISIGSWLVASLLPRYVDQVSIESTMSVAESTVSRFSIYRELRDASLDEDFERILAEMMKEWTYVGACLIALAGLDATIFSTTSGGTNGPQSGSSFQMTELTQQLIAVSSIFTGLGLAIDAWFMLRYGLSNPAKFQKNALDVYDTYLSFSVTSRIPIVFTFLSACSLMGFLVIVSSSVWPTAAIVLCGLAGVACTLQYLIYGIHSVWCFSQRILRLLRNAVIRVFARLYGKSTSNDETSNAAAAAEAVSPVKTPLPPLAHVSTTTSHAPNRPLRNPARVAPTF